MSPHLGCGDVILFLTQTTLQLMYVVFSYKWDTTKAHLRSLSSVLKPLSGIKVLVDAATPYLLASSQRLWHHHLGPYIADDLIGLFVICESMSTLYYPLIWIITVLFKGFTVCFVKWLLSNSDSINYWQTYFISCFKMLKPGSKRITIVNDQIVLMTTIEIQSVLQLLLVQLNECSENNNPVNTADVTTTNATKTKSIEPVYSYVHFKQK